MPSRVITQPTYLPRESAAVGRCRSPSDPAPGQHAYGFEDLVDEIIYSHECGMSKPDPGIYALACERLRVGPARMVFLDDYEPCVEGARQAGIRAVLYQDNTQAVSDIGDLLAATGCK
jgi:FMN phosphatase YigB (HAD superfamily)